ncbi:LuxR C-terminal-related transcriptional regulator [Pedococcus sp. KACC 23699]|uniref:LuxR C-terminal-related transcriptional regulator n=1 Tax=Pedococcus sp. KACC 23699 TaxID=3149228 RepID=A0AAU7JSD2_9MICO
MAVLGTKLHRPVPRRELVPRPRLTDRMVAGAHPRLVLVSAPAGSGKTTLLSQWLDTTAAGDRVAWVSLDEADNDPRRFLEHLVAALQTVGDFDEAVERVTSAGPVPADAVMESVVNELDLQPRGIVIALDDYHVVEAPEVQRAVAFLLDHLPPHAVLAIATRADPALPLARLRARGELVEVRGVDLRFTPDEAGSFLSDVMGLRLDDVQVAALESRTEGWATGLQLAGLSLRGVEDTARFVEDFTGSHRFVLDYLVEEVLRHQPEPVRRFLLETSVLDQLTGPLCDALTGAADGSATLEMLDRGNVFVIALDDERRWYRYHHLFADALKARLGAGSPLRVPLLHRAARDWYAAQRRPEDALRHALLAEDPERAADLLEALLPDVRRERRDVELREWLVALPDDTVRGRGLLATYRAWSSLVEGDLDGVEGWLSHAEAALVANPAVAAPDASVAALEELRTLPATVAIFRASAAQAHGDTDASERHARRALELTGPADHMARGGALGFLGLAAWARGDLTAAVPAFSRAVDSLAGAGDVADELGSAVVLGSMWLARGRPDEARRLYSRALSTAQRHPGDALTTLGDLHVGLADVLLEQGDLAAAAEHLATARSLGESTSLFENRYRWFVAAARLRRAQGDLEAAVDLLDRAQQLHLPGFFPELHPVAAQRARVRIAQGRLADATDWARTREVEQVDEPGYLDEYDQLTLVRLLLARHRAGDPGAGDDQVAHERSGDGRAPLDEARFRLERLVPDAAKGGRDGSLVEIWMLQALVQDAAGDRRAALSHLEAALVRAVPAGFVGLFLDEGEPMDRLLATAERMPTAGADARTLRHAAYRRVVAVPAPTAVEGLSDREREVLVLLATALSGPEIARELFVSVNTLRTHTKHIFTKLDVRTRRAAVSRASELGLI